MEEISKKDNRFALLGTISFHGVLLVLLLFLGFRTPLPLPEEQGVLVALGYSDQGSGDLISLSGAPQAPSHAQSSPDPEEFATQSTEESVSLPPTTASRPQTQPQQEPVQQQVQEEPQKPQQQVDARALFPGPDQRSSSQSQGNTGQQDVQGKPTGAPDGSGDGLGQVGVSFSLEGRRANKLPPVPKYNAQDEGIVVVSIKVNPQGDVISAKWTKGTTILDPTLRREAEKSALQARFDKDETAPPEQTGTITYNFMRRN